MTDEWGVFKHEDRHRFVLDYGSGRYPKKLLMVEVNEPLDEPDKIRSKKRSLEGWYSDKEYKDRWDFKCPVRRDITPYAK